MKKFIAEPNATGFLLHLHDKMEEKKVQIFSTVKTTASVQDFKKN